MFAVHFFLLAWYKTDVTVTLIYSMWNNIRIYIFLCNAICMLRTFAEFLFRNVILSRLCTYSYFRGFFKAQITLVFTFISHLPHTIYYFAIVNGIWTSDFYKQQKQQLALFRVTIIEVYVAAKSVVININIAGVFRLSLLGKYI